MPETPSSLPYPQGSNQSFIEKSNQAAKTTMASIGQVASNVKDNVKNGYSGPGGPLTSQSAKNVVQDYRWTLSNISAYYSEIPFIELKEFKCNESAIHRQLDLYTKIVGNTVDNVASLFKSKPDQKEAYQNVDEVYSNVWPKNNPTGNLFTFPYFSAQAFGLQTSDWQALDALGDSLGQLAGSISPGLGELVTAGIKAADAVTDLAMKLKYPNVGVVDRPKLFASHSNRTINISFPLFNTVDERDWIKHRDLIYTLMYQNLFYKRDYVTGIPPVFYEVRVPGQYYCYAAAVTDIKVENLGNTRLLNGTQGDIKTGQRNGDIVPDAYQVNLTLTELVMPSQNQFKTIMNGQKNTGFKPRILVGLTPK